MTRGLPQRDALLARGFLHLLDGARADAARGEVDHAQQRIVVGRVGDQAQIGERMFHLLPLEKAQAAINPIRNRGAEQRMLQYPRLRIGAVQQRDLRLRHTLIGQRADFIHDEARLIMIGAGAIHPDRLARAFRRPQIFAQALAVMADQHIGRIQDIALRAVILFQLDHLGHGEFGEKGLHIAGMRAAKGVDRLIVVAHREHGVVFARDAFQPGVLKAAGVLKLVHQNIFEARLVMRAQQLIARQQFIGAQQQLGKIHHALALALLLVGGIQITVAQRGFVQRLDIIGAQALLFGVVDEIRHLLRWKALVVDIQRLHQALDHRELVLAIQNLKQLRQIHFAVMRAQQPVAQAMKRAHPHAARIDRQHAGDAREHFLRRLVSESHRQHPGGAHLAGLNQIGDARGEHTRLAAARAGQNQRRLVRQGHGGELFGVEVFEKCVRGHRKAAWRWDAELYGISRARAAANRRRSVTRF